MSMGQRNALKQSASSEAERYWDRALHVQTAGIEYWVDRKFMPYEPTPYPVLLRLADSGLIASTDHVLDYGCGKGRVAFLLCAKVGCRVTGIDRSEKLISLAEQNRSSFEKRELVRFLHESAERYSPVEENVCFFFNPFSEKILDIALRRILSACPERKKKLLFYYPSAEYLARLESEPQLKLTKEIDCRDLFDGSKDRERIVIYETRP